MDGPAYMPHSFKEFIYWFVLVLIMAWLGRWFSVLAYRLAREA